MSAGRAAHIYVLVPLHHAEWNALIELLFTEADRRGVHGADQLVTVALFFIEQRGRLSGIKAESLADGVLILGEVVHLLRDIGQKNCEALFQRHVIVTIFFQRRPGLFHHLRGLGGIAGLRLTQLAHVHVSGHVYVVMVAVAHSFSGGVELGLLAV